MATYYISDADGDDTSGDGSSGSPYKTIAKGLTIRGGSNTYVIHSGTYSEGPLTYTSTDSVTITTAGDGNVTVQHPNSGDSHIFKVGADWHFEASLDLILRPSTQNTAPAIWVNNTEHRVHVTGTAFIGPRITAAGGPQTHTNNAKGAMGILGGGVNVKGCYFYLLNNDPIRVEHTGTGTDNATFGTSSIDSCLIYRCGGGAEDAYTTDSVFGIDTATTDGRGCIIVKSNTITECTGVAGMQFGTGRAQHVAAVNNLVYNNYLFTDSGAGVDCYGIGMNNTNTVHNIQLHSNNSYNPNRDDDGDFWEYYRSGTGGSSSAWVPSNNYITEVTNFDSISKYGDKRGIALANKSFSEARPNLNYIEGLGYLSANGSTTPGTIKEGKFFPLKHYPSASSTSYDGADISHNMNLGSQISTGSAEISFQVYYPPGNASSTQGTTVKVVIDNTDILGHTRFHEGAEASIGCFETLYDFGIGVCKDAIDEVAGDFAVQSYNRRSCEYAKNANQTNFIPYIKGPINLRGRNTSYKVENS